jgi:hypothetical protein
MPLDVPSFGAAAAAAAHKRGQVTLQTGHGQTNVVTRDRNPLSRLVQWISPDKANNRSRIRALHGALRAQYGNAIGDTLTTGGVAPGAGRNGYPILIFDQSGQPLLGQNRNTLAAIGLQYNVRVESISMQDVTALGNKLGLTKMFDTTGTGRAGYAGARNIANLAALVFDAAIKEDPTRTIADVINLPAATLKGVLQNEIGNGKTVLMGDDDASLRPGFLHAKALITDEHPDEYVTSKTIMDGRGTTAAVLPNTAQQVGTGSQGSRCRRWHGLVPRCGLEALRQSEGNAI